MPRPKKKIEEIKTEPVSDLSFAHQKMVGIAQSKRAPLLTGKKAQQLYDLLKEIGVKMFIDQAITMPQYEQGKRPLARFIMVREFRVVLDQTES